MSAIVFQASIVGLITLLAAACIADVASMRIPNWTSIGIAGFFLVAAFATPHGMPWWASHVGAGLVVLFVGMAIFAFDLIGGGDVKLLAAGSLWAGFGQLPTLLLAIGIIGGGLIIAVWALRRIRLGVLLAARNISIVSLQDGKGIPYAVAIAVGCCMLLPNLTF